MKITKTALPEEDDIVIEKRGGGKSPTLNGGWSVAFVVDRI